MKIEKAIEILTDLLPLLFQRQHYNDRDALKLAIEALKAVKECRASHMFCPGLIMPGETLEDGDGVHAIQRP